MSDSHSYWFGNLFIVFFKKNELIELVQMYRDKIEVRIGENCYSKPEVEDIGKRLKQLNREVI